MHSSVTFSAVFVLALSQLSTALPRVQDGQLFPRVTPQYDGARYGCHPEDYIIACTHPDEQVGVDKATAEVTSVCKTQCWPALDGESAADWRPQDCAVSCFPILA